MPKKILIVGGGFGGLRAAKGLRRSPFDLTLIDRTNHHLFQPLLYQVATASLSPADIAVPIRGVLKRRPGLQVLMAEVSGVDLAKRELVLGHRRLPYDVLVLATGARHSYFGHDEWAQYAPGLKSITDATAIRERVLLAFERAEMEESPEERRKLLNFVLIGGGPTGVEMAGSIAELARVYIARDFRRIDPRATRVILIEAGQRVLAGFPPSLSEKARVSLEKLGVEVRTGLRVDHIDSDCVRAGKESFTTKNVVWTAGVTASRAATWLGAQADRSGRVIVNQDLTLPGHPEVYVIGDTAAAPNGKGGHLPGLAPVAMQQGHYVARHIRARLNGKPLPPAFHYRDKGIMATIGRSAAVTQVGRLHLSGFIAWVAWIVVHILYLIDFRNRLLVLTQWFWAYATFHRGARLITHTPAEYTSAEAEKRC